MTEIQNNVTLPQQQMMPMSKEALRYQVEMDRALRAPRMAQDEFVRQHKRNGLVERLYNGIKNLTGLGIGSKKVKAELAKVESGEITDEQARETVDKYRKSQVNSQQAFGDLMSIGASGLTFFGVINGAKKKQAVRKLNKKFGSRNILDELSGKNSKEVMKAIFEEGLAHANSKTKLTLLAAWNAALIGGFVKWGSLLINRIGSKGVDKKEFNGAMTPYDNAAYKFAKKEASKERGKNFLSGMINGAMLPLTMVGSAFVGVPLYFIGNSLNRYFVANGKEKNKSFSGYIDNLKSDAIIHGALAVGAAIPMAKNAHYSAVLDKNLKKAFDTLMSKPYLRENPYGGNSAYNQIESVLFEQPELRELFNGRVSYKDFSNYTVFTEPKSNEIKEAKNISQDFKSYIAENFGKDAKVISQTRDNKFLIRQADNTETWIKVSEHDRTRSLTQEELVQKLIDDNILAAKLKQIKGAEQSNFLFFSKIGDTDPITRALREGCPPTRTLEEAATEINKALGGGYQVLKNVGTGTVAETYLAKDATGKEVCIKIIKKGINVEKIAKDKEKTIELIKNMEGKSDAEKKYLIKNIEDLADGISKEVDLANEMEMANKLKPFTKTANVVQGIKCENNVYVMEKAKGVSLEKLLEMTRSKDKVVYKLKHLEAELAKAESNEARKSIQLKIDTIKEEQKEILEQISDITDDDLNYILKNYMDVLVEQLYKIGKEGRTLHADIHPGNIFIDLDALKNQKGKLFTLIDTGNVITLNALQAEQSMKLTNYIKNGDTKDIAKYFVEDADFSASNLSKEQAAEKIEQELNKLFFDYETRLGTVTNTDVINITSNIMKDMDIMPGQTQLNLEKAKVSAEKSFDTLIHLLQDNTEKAVDEAKGMGKLTTFIQRSNKQTEIMEQYRKLQSEQEKRNLWQMIKSPREFFKSRNNPNYKKENSVEYLTYYLKQRISAPSKNDKLTSIMDNLG